ncbi:metallophosphoesterase [Enterococcus sp. AZ128]|uniref:metallophosphoesterase n=1 Tax=Enterococcus sp. AZ128 TaxID=2774630 RepID=UPI003F683071
MGFTTDAHYVWGVGKANSWLGLENLNNILSLSSKLDLVVSGGDNGDGGNYSYETNLSDTVRYCNYFWTAFPDSDRFIVRGNHDSGGIQPYAQNGKVLPNDIISKEDFKKLYRTKESNFGEVRNGDSLYGYKDYPNKKIRVIWVDTLDNPENILDSDGAIKYPTWRNAGFQQEQLKWIAEKALGECPDDYHVVTFGHFPIRWTTATEDRLKRNFEQMALIIKSFINRSKADIVSTMTDYSVNFSVDYSNRQQSNFVGHFCGHEHWDGIVKTENFNNIICRNAWCDTSADSLAGTVNEDAFRVIQIDTDSKSVSILGFGRSSNRTFTY